ncbi:hypothetical protein BH24ACT5_BH24ACT5_06790 [soil metagenome]
MKTRTKLLGAILAATIVFGFGANVSASVSTMQEAPPTTTPVFDEDGCPNVTYEGVFHWNEMRQLYSCMIPLVEDFFYATYGADWQPPFAYNYVSYDETIESGCAGGDANLTDYFYCPGDNQVYLGAGQIWSFYLMQGDIAPMMALAHEVAHYTQDLYIPTPNHEETQLERIAAENQADCVSGAWVQFIEGKGILESDDLSEVEVTLLEIADAEDDFERIHGDLQERTNAFNSGYQQGISSCNDIYMPITGVELAAQATPVVPQAGANSISTETAPDMGAVYDCASGPISEPCRPVVVGSIQPPASCENAILVDSCNDAFSAAYDRWGNNLPHLYDTADRGVTLGVFLAFTPDWAYFSALDACIDVVANEEGAAAGQQVWFARTQEIFSNTDPYAFRLLFNSAMELVCPDAGWTPIYDAAEVIPDSTPPTTSVTPETGVTVLITTSEGDLAYSCSDILYPESYENARTDDSIDASTICSEGDEDNFAYLVNGNATAFNSYVYSGTLGAFSGDQYSVSETAWTGFGACLIMRVDGDYEGYSALVRDVYTEVTPADTQQAWDTALRVLCPPT